MTTDTTHVDRWLDTPSIDPQENYAKFIIDYFRLPAWKQSAFKGYLMSYKLFCTYESVVYRCTGASRIGDVWLNSDYTAVNGYTLRVNVTDCSNWSSEPSLCEPSYHKYLVMECATAMLDSHRAASLLDGDKLLLKVLEEYSLSLRDFIRCTDLSLIHEVWSRLK